MNCVALVREYYRRIDACDIDWVTRLFDARAAYSRADATYIGGNAIALFFGEQRKIRGRHQIERIIMGTLGNVVTAVGRFHGVGHRGDRRDVGFVDVWTFNTSGLVTRRQTYLARGNEYVRE
ncbi:nuclear transport factor 2 family protein [Rhizobium sp. BR 314]|uniref:nuclear transport factor 2 family protein n=1 Tax=Rhizobium sp. BR 314 TaxID=3040013 RepID=UPI0039BFA611